MFTEEDRLEEDVNKFLEILESNDRADSVAIVEEGRCAAVTRLATLFAHGLAGEEHVELTVIQALVAVGELSKKCLRVLTRENSLAKKIEKRICEVDTDDEERLTVLIVLALDLLLMKKGHKFWSGEVSTEFLQKLLDLVIERENSLSMATVCLTVRLHAVTKEKFHLERVILQHRNRESFAETFVLLFNRGENLLPKESVPFLLSLLEKSNLSRLFYDNDIDIMVQVILREIRDASNNRLLFFELLYQLLQEGRVLGRKPRKRSDIITVLRDLHGAGDTEEEARACAEHLLITYADILD